jgi:lipoyl(octanoyl) transferase
MHIVMALRKDIASSLYSDDAVRWEVSQEPQAYVEAVARMEREAAAIAKGEIAELVWLVEHPALYTAGTSAKPQDLVEPDRFSVYQTGRGGQYTYHGPGQRIAYVMLDLKKRGGDVRGFVAGLERWIIATLEQFSIHGETREDRVGVWVARPGREDKIAALGIRVRHGVSFHGIAINVSPELSHFDGIVPCGISQHGVTSFAALGLDVEMPAVDQALATSFIEIFGRVAN